MTFRAQMKSSAFRGVCIALAFATLASCTTVEGSTGVSKPAQGAILGALGGLAICALASGNTTECVLAAAAGAAVGYGLGTVVDRRDVAARDKALQRALGAEGATRNANISETGATGANINLTGVNQYTDGQGRTCRRWNGEYVKTDGTRITKPEVFCQASAGGKWEPVTV